MTEVLAAPATTMTRLRVTSAGTAAVEVVPSLDDAPGEVVVRVESCGLCGSDATMFAGRHPVIAPPLVPGHEIVGVVRSADEAHADLVGQRVAVLPQVGCGECRQCLRDSPRLCASMRLIGGQIEGGAAEEVRVPADALVVIPDSVPREVAPIVEPLAVARHAVTRAPVADAEVLVVGGGPIGLLVALSARAAGARRVTLVEPVAARQQVVAHFGIDVVGAAPDDEFDVVFDCVGGSLPTTLLGSVVAGGTLVLVGVAAPELSFDGMLLQRQERTIAGSHMYTRVDFTAALELLANGLLPTDATTLGMLFDRRPLSDGVRALEDLAARRSNSLKLLLVPGA